MEDAVENNSEIVPIGSNSLVRVGNSIDITNKLLIGSDFQFAGDFKGEINWTSSQINKIIGIAFFQSKVVCLLENNSISFLNPTNGIELFELEIPLVDDSPTTLKPFNDEYLFIGTKKGKIIKFNDAFTEVLNLNLEIRDIGFSYDNQLMALLAESSTTIWRVSDFKFLYHIEDDYCGFYKIYFHSDNTHVLGISREAGDGGLYSTNIQNSQDTYICSGFTISINYIKGLIVIEDTIDLWKESKKITIRDLNSWNLIYERNMEENVSSVVFSPNGNYIIIGFKSGLCQIIDTMKYRIIASLHTNVPYCLRDLTFSTDSKKIFGYSWAENKIVNII